MYLFGGGGNLRFFWGPPPPYFLCNKITVLCPYLCSGGVFWGGGGVEVGGAVWEGGVGVILRWGAVWGGYFGVVGQFGGCLEVGRYFGGVILRWGCSWGGMEGNLGGRDLGAQSGSSLPPQGPHMILRRTPIAPQDPSLLPRIPHDTPKTPPKDPQDTP